MTPSRTMLPLLMVALLAALVAACGGDAGGGSEGDGEGGDARDAGARTEPTPEEAAEAKTGTGSLTITPELTTCMRAAGFAQDATPVTGAVASWRGAGGRLVVVAPTSEAALTIAGGLGTASAPADVDGSHVTVGPPRAVAAALDCLDA